MRGQRITMPLAHALATGACCCIVTLARAADVPPPGPAAVDASVRKAVHFLAGAQQPDGSFPGKYGNTSAAVSLVGMSFLARGDVPGHGPYGRTINRCVDFVLNTYESPTGAMGLPPQSGLLINAASGDHSLYSHNIAALFLSEVSGMVDPVRQHKIDQALPKAVHLILSAQRVAKPAAHAGGWRYAVNSGDSDLSCSGWAIMALRSAKLNGAPVPDKAIEQAIAYVLRNRNAGNGGFGYQDRNANLVLTGAALLCLELTGRHATPETLAAGDFLMRAFDQLPQQAHSSYGLYYAAQGTFQLGGKYWQRFSDWMYDFYIKRQNGDGSWSPLNGSGGGPAYETAMITLAFTVPYRQLPIYQRDEGGEARPPADKAAATTTDP